MATELGRRPRRRRQVLATAAVLAMSVLGTTACGAAADQPAGTGPAAGGQVVWADYGGPTNKSRQTAFFDGFAAESGVAVNSVTLDFTAADTQLKGGAGGYDAVQQGVADMAAYLPGLAVLDADVPRDTTLPAQLRDYGFASFVTGYAIGYPTATFPQGPQSWADFWDVARFPGKRAWPGSPTSFYNTCEAAQMAAGKSPAQLYPLDLDLCTRMFDQLRPDMVFYQSYPEVQQLLASGTAAMAFAPTGQYYGLKNAGQDITIVWTDAIVSRSAFVVPANAPNKANVMALAKAFADPRKQAQFAQLTGYGPANPEAFAHLEPEAAANIVNAPEHTRLVEEDYAYYASNGGALLDWYTTWLGAS
ncbi:hypothetical protein BJF78_00760 [Pseudonocardia sp. CNS-139]|nr:hypothetical protein BJF78_00760 [Pseudonocardia sp. CNS-139]